MQLDKERLEKLAPQLSAQNIDPESLPEPGSDEWRSMIRDLSLRDPVLAQQTAGLVFDPNELTKSSLLDQQAKRSQARGGFGKLLSPLMKTTTANGDEVPNTTLTRNLVIGGAVLACLAFWFGIPHAQPVKSTTSAAAKPSGSGRPTSTGQPVSTSSSKGGIDKPVSSGSAGVKDNTASPAVTSNSPDQTGFGSTDTQAAPSQNAVPTSAIMPTSTPSDSTGFQTPAPTSPPSGFAFGGNGAPSSVRITPPSVRMPVTPTAAGPVRLSPTKPLPSVPVAPKPRLVALNPGAANGNGAVNVPVRRLVASSGNSGGTPASSGSVTSVRDLKSSAASSSAAADQAGTSSRGRLLNTVAAVPSAQVIALNVISPVGAPAAAQLVSTQAASTPAASPAVSNPTQSASSATAGGQSVTPPAGRPGLGLSSAASQNAAGTAADTARYGLLQSGGASVPEAGNSASGSAVPGRQSVGLLSQGSASSAAAGNAPSSNAPVNSTPPATGSPAAPVATSYGLKGLGPTRSTPVTSAAPATPTASAPTAAAPSPASPTAPPAPVAQAPVLPPYPVGQPLAAKLVLGVVAVDGAQSTVPVFAKTDDGATWRGTASLDGRKRLQIQFSAVLRNGAEQAVTADAYGNDGQPGLAASVRITTPTLAADLLSGVFSGVKAFADATINQRNVSVQAGTGNTGNVVTSTAANTPNFWLVTAGNALGQFQLPQNKATIVNVAEVKAGTALNLVVRGEQR